MKLTFAILLNAVTFFLVFSTYTTAGFDPYDRDSISVLGGSYTSTAGTSIPNATDTNVPFNNVIYDSNSAYNTSTGIYTVPTSGKYAVSATIYFASGAWTAGNNIHAIVYKNGSPDAAQELYLPVTGTYYPGSCTVSKTISASAGDTIEIRAYQNSGGSRSLYSANSLWNSLSIQRVGN